MTIKCESYSSSNDVIWAKVSGSSPVKLLEVRCLHKQCENIIMNKFITLVFKISKKVIGRRYIYIIIY